MTLSLAAYRVQRANAQLVTPRTIASSDVTVVVPVKNDQEGVCRLLRSFECLPRDAQPHEVIVVDNLSCRPIELPASGLKVRLLSCDVPGPAAARNVGWRASGSPWVLFLDADCIPTATTLSGFAKAANGAVGYAGEVRAWDRGFFAEYYDAQRTLIPPPVRDQRPAYLVTANALVWREALVAIDGFRDDFDVAGGEDIDLALRLGSVGDLSFAGEAVVFHEFGGQVGQFVRRFIRYGRGNRQVEILHDVRMSPVPFVPVRRTPSHLLCAMLQFGAICWGYAHARVTLRT